MKMFKMKEKMEQNAFVIFGILFILLLLLNCLTPMVADDYQYCFIFNRTEKVGSLFDIIKSQFYHYFEWGGRTVAHLLVQFFLLLGKPIFNVFNTIITIIYVWLIGKLSFYNSSKNFGYLLAFFMAWFFMPAYGSVFLWLTGACNYLWCAVIMFSLILIYFRNTVELKKMPGYLSILIALWGIAAGWCNENTSAMTVYVCIALTIYCRFKWKRVELWQITGIFGEIAGYFIMILAPGNYIRASAYDGGNIIFRLHKSWMQANAVMFDAEGRYAAIFILFIISFVLIIFMKIDLDRKIVGSIWFSAAFVGNYAMILSPKYPPRASFGVRTMFFVSIIYCLNIILSRMKTDYQRYFHLIVISVISLYFLNSYAEALYDIGGTWFKDKARIETVHEEKEKGNLVIEVPGMSPKTEYNVFKTIADWPDYDVARYYGVEKIIVK